MFIFDWAKELPISVSICDGEGTIIYLTDKEAAFFADRGGQRLIGSSLFDCHSETSAEIIRELMKKQEVRVYILEENGERDLLIQTPWYQDGVFKGLVEITVGLKESIPTVVR